MSQAPRSGTAQAALLCQQSTWEPDAGHEETGVGQHSTRRLHCHTLSELRRFPSHPIWRCASCVTTPTKPFGKQTQATERRALDSTAHVDSTVVYCMSRVDVPGTQIWHCASCATMSAKHLGTRRRPRGDGRWTAQHTQTPLSHLVRAASLSQSANLAMRKLRYYANKAIWETDAGHGKTGAG